MRPAFGSATLSHDQGELWGPHAAWSRVKESGLALFPWKKSGGGTENKESCAAQPAAANNETFELSPEKAKRFFEVARNRHDVESYDYAMNMWLNGLRFDPGNVDGIKGFTASAAGHVNKTGDKGPSKDLEAVVNGRTPVHKYLGQLLTWGFSPTEPERAVRATVAASDLGLREAALYMGTPALKLVMNDKRPRKDQFIRLMQVFEKNEAFDLAVVAGDGAVKVDPSDAKLSADLRNMAARSTMNKGGYSQSGEAGGFRGNVKDLDKQRKLEEEERIGKTDDVHDRVVNNAKAEYTANPGDRPTIVRYVKALMDRGRDGDEDAAHAVLTKAYGETQEFRFRQTAGELRMKQGRRKLRELEAQMKANASDAVVKAAFVEAEQKQTALEISEYELLTTQYPTDLKMKYELGKRYFVAGRHTDAIGQFQQAKLDGKMKNDVLLMLGQCFEQIDWSDEAIETYRQALDGYGDPNDTLGLELRYHLVLCLKKRAENEKDLASAEEADKLASAIAMHNIGYKDIRDVRTQIKGVIQKIKSP